MKTILGIDEVGRGCIAGPIVGAGVIFTQEENWQKALKDSKLLSKKQREKFDQEIKEKAEKFFIVEISPEEIDEKGIAWANQELVRRIAKNIDSPYQILVHDFIKGYQLEEEYIPNGVEYKNEIRADQNYPSVSAASIIAKVYRDALMLNYAQQFPEYGFEKHVGYFTAEHKKAFEKYGPCPLHRKSFEPIKSFYLKNY